MIKVEKINKKFIKQSKNKKKEEFYADKDISFEAKDNEVLGILGPNGAGKTTLLRMIAGIMTPSGGSITIDNLNYKVTIKVINKSQIDLVLKNVDKLRYVKDVKRI